MSPQLRERVTTMIINLLRGFFIVVFVSMVYITVKAGMHENLFAAIARLSDDPWAVATLWDAYFGFLTFYIWVLHREGWLGRIVWFVLIMSLGNMAMAAYALIKLFKVEQTATFADVVVGPRR